MSAPTTTPRPRWLQFSLRWLLALITIGAVVLAGYRWNWEVVEIEPGTPGERETIHGRTYHYGWNGTPVKHGPERIFQLETGAGSEYIWVEGEMVNERSFVGGELIESRLSQPFAPDKSKTRTLPDATVVAWDGNVADTSGRWTLQRNQNFAEVITQTVAWRNSQRHGPSVWKNFSGEVLQSAEFERGRIMKWNGEPIEVAFPQWLEQKIPDAELRRALSARLQVPLDYEQTAVNDHGFTWQPKYPGPTVLVLFGFDQQTKDPSPWQDRFLHRVFGEILLECALNNWSTLDFRYGCVCTVPISSGPTHWRDPTGSDQIQFEAGSTAERQWSELVGTDLHQRDFPALRIKELFAGTAINVDVSAVAELDVKLLSERGQGSLPYYPRPRRHLLGHILYQSGYVCIQNSDGLILVKPRPER